MGSLLILDSGLSVIPTLCTWTGSLTYAVGRFARVLRSYYGLEGHLLQPSRRSGASAIWSGICHDLSNTQTNERPGRGHTASLIHDQMRTPIVTPWRLLNFFAVLAFGIAKLAEALKEKVLRATVLDGVLGVVWFGISFWIAFLETEERASPSVKWFFHNDVSRALLPLLAIAGIITGSITIQATGGLLYSVKVLCIAILMLFGFFGGLIVLVLLILILNQR
ncbi:hypothetical protein K438DRAFT_1943696 [Mycena galopus ATCC 62051]|nr:hypothetical protein K438DRAFT_1943696 [Mycena galopus ATCC 62051]